jgi:hypothetical protein
MALRQAAPGTRHKAKPPPSNSATVGTSANPSTFSTEADIRDPPQK